MSLHLITGSGVAIRAYCADFFKQIVKNKNL